MAIGNHLSSVIDFHIPEALRDENPQFVKFLKSYYQFLESIQLCSNTSTGTFVEGTVLTGETSKATGKILSVDTSKEFGEGVYVYVHPTNGVHFDVGETISTSTGSAILNHFRRNPLNARDSTWDWSDVNSPNNEYIYNYRHELFENFPENIQIDKTLFAKHIKELYLDKGNERSYKTLFRLAFGQVKGRLKEHLEFYYPKNDLLKLSDGQWIQSITLQVSQLADNYNFLAKDIVGQTSGAKAFVTELALKKISTVNVIELYLKNMIGKFSLGETIQATTPENDGSYANTVLLGMIATDPTINAISVINPGNGYTGDGNIFFENKIPLIGGAGVGQEVVVGKTSNDQVTNLTLTGRGFGYSNNDVIDFDNTGKDPQSSAQAKVSSLLEGTTSIVSVNDQKVYELTNTHVITLSTETDIPLRKGFLLSNHKIYDDELNSTKRGLVLETFSNTVFRYSLTEGIPFVTTDTIYAFREDEFAYTPHLSAEVESTFEYSHDVVIGQENYNTNSANTSYSGIFGQRLENFTTENPSNLITEDGDQLISELFRPITSSSTSLSGILDYSDKTIGQIGTIEITDYGRLYKGKPTATIKVNEDFQEVNGIPDNGIGPFGNNGAVEVATMGGQIQDIIVRNPGAAFTTTVPEVDFSGFGDGNANATLILDSVRYYDGYYVGTDGQLSSQKKIQDSKYYQDFSYVILADQDINNYRDLVLNTVHPAGTELFGEVIVRSEIEAAMFDQGRNSINTLDSRGFTQYRDLMLVVETPLIDVQIPAQTVKSDRNWEFYMEAEKQGIVYIDGIPLKDGTTSTVAANRIETHKADKESGFEKIWDDVRFWSTIQTYELGIVSPHYSKSYIDMSTFNISSNTTEYTFNHTYEPNTLQIFIGDRLVKQSDITQTSGTSFTLKFSGADIQGSGSIHNAPLTIISSYIKVKQRPQNVIDGGAIITVSHETTTDGGDAYLYTSYESSIDGGSAVLESTGGGLYINDDETVMINAEGTLGDVLRNQKMLTKNVSLIDSTVTLIRSDGYYFDDYSNLSIHFSGDKFPILYNVSDTLWTKSTIEVLHDQKMAYYANEKIYDYNWHSPTNDMTNVFSADDEFFIDRRKLESLDSIILEDGDNIVSELNNFTIRMEGVIVGGPNATDWPFLISDYQFHTIKSVDPYKVTLHQPVRYRENYGWDNSASNIPALFTLENQTIMKRT